MSSQLKGLKKKKWTTKTGEKKGAKRETNDATKHQRKERRDWQREEIVREEGKRNRAWSKDAGVEGMYLCITWSFLYFPKEDIRGGKERRWWKRGNETKGRKEGLQEPVKEWEEKKQSYRYNSFFSHLLIQEPYSSSYSSLLTQCLPDSFAEISLTWRLNKNIWDRKARNCLFCHWKKPFLFDHVILPQCSILFSCESLTSLTSRFNIVFL